MLKLFLFILFTTSIFLCFTQKQEFIGILKTNNNQIITYKISFTVDNSGKVTGKSITDYFGFNQTESSISGYYNSKKGSLSFSETKNLNTKSSAGKSEFCYVSANDLNVRKVSGKEIVSGSFIGNFPSGEKCAQGSIYLVNAYELETIVGKNKSLDSLKTVMEKSTRLTKNSIHELKWVSNSVIINIWDSYIEDQDKINIYVNGTLRYGAIEAKEKSAQYTIPFIDKEMVIKIEALNEGTAPPNTANLNLIDKSAGYLLQTILKKGESMEIHLSK
jgi:hypothetical protein